METHLERLCHKDRILNELAQELEAAVVAGPALEIEKAFNAIAFARNNALNAAINHFSARCFQRGFRVRKPCDNKVKVEEVILDG